MDRTHPFLFWIVFPIVWVNFLAFPIIGILAIGWLGGWGALYFPAAFGFILWAGEWNTLMESKPDRTWRDHRAIILEGVIGGPLVCAGLFGILWVVGMMGESYAQHSTELARCQKQAATPYEYQRC